MARVMLLFVGSKQQDTTHTYSSVHHPRRPQRSAPAHPSQQFLACANNLKPASCCCLAAHLLLRQSVKPQPIQAWHTQQPTCHTQGSVQPIPGLAAAGGRTAEQ